MSFLNNKPSQMELYPIITGIFCGCLIVSNILASKTFSFYDFILPCGVVIFPIVYIVGDVLTEIYGFKLAKRAIYLGFVMSLIAVIAYQIAMFLPGTDAATSNAFNIILGKAKAVLKYDEGLFEEICEKIETYKQTTGRSLKKKQ